MLHPALIVGSSLNKIAFDITTHRVLTDLTGMFCLSVFRVDILWATDGDVNSQHKPSYTKSVVAYFGSFNLSEL